MKRITTLLIPIVMMVLFISPARAQRTSVTRGVRVYFPLDKADLSDSYLENSGAFAAIDSLIASAPLWDNRLSLELHSYSSLEGPYQHNCELSLARANALADYLVRHWPAVKEHLKVFPGDEAWDDFREAVSSDPQLTENGRARMLEIIDSPRDPDVKGWLLKLDPEYETASRHFLRERYAHLVWTISAREKEPGPEPGPTVTAPPIPQNPPVITKPEEKPVQKPTWYPLFAVGTNLLLDGAVVVDPIYFTPNIEVEVPIGKHWSVWGEYTFPWWVTPENNRAWQILKWDMGARWYFSRLDPNDPMDVLRGHHIGLDLSAGYYDIEPRHIGYQGEFQLIGLEYGYAFRLGRSFRLDINVGFGWMGSHYRFYAGDNTDVHLLYQNNGLLNWFGPTKAGLSIKYIIPYRKKEEVK